MSGEHATYQLVDRAIRCRQLDELIQLTTDRPDIINCGYYEMTLLARATQIKWLEGANLLIEKGADIDRADMHGWFPIQLAAENGDVEMLKLFFQHNCQSLELLNRNNQTAFHCAAESGSLETVEFLLQQRRKGNFDIRGDRDLETPLYIAAERGHPGIVEAFLKAGSKLESVDRYGRTPLHAACSITVRYQPVSIEDRIATIHVLMRAGANPHAVSNNEYTPICQAIVSLCKNGPTTSEVILTLLSYDSSCLEYKYHKRSLVDLAVLYSPRVKNIDLLRALGVPVITTNPHTHTDAMIEIVTKPLEEDFVLEMRYRVYFYRSLTERLVFSLSDETST